MRKFFLALLGLLVYAPAYAQTGACPTSMALVVSPSWICMTPSVDPAGGHNATDPLTGQPVVARYDLLFFAPGVDTATGAPIQTINIGKPTVNAQGAAWLQRSELAAIPVGQQYRARVVAVGPNGTSPRSAESNPFGRSSLPMPSAPARVSVSAEQ